MSYHIFGFLIKKSKKVVILIGNITTFLRFPYFYMITPGLFPNDFHHAFHLPHP